jgi:hypothetical protein
MIARGGISNGIPPLSFTIDKIWLKFGNICQAQIAKSAENSTDNIWLIDLNILHLHHQK